MANLKVVLNRKGVKELLMSDEMQAICLEHANAAQQRLGTGYEVTSRKGCNRANASIRANTRKAVKEQLEDNTILKALK